MNRVETMAQRTVPDQHGRDQALRATGADTPLGQPIGATLGAFALGWAVGYAAARAFGPSDAVTALAHHDGNVDQLAVEELIAVRQTAIG